MINFGVVTKTTDKNAQITVMRETACGGECGNCNACSNNSVSVLVPNNVNLSSGDRVKISMPDNYFVLSALLGYGIPTIALISGIGFTYYFTGNDGFSIIGGVLSLAIVLFLQKFFFKNSNIKVQKVD